jgi:hypothetical protein
MEKRLILTTERGKKTSEDVLETLFCGREAEHPWRRILGVQRGNGSGNYGDTRVSVWL